MNRLAAALLAVLCLAAPAYAQTPYVGGGASGGGGGGGGATGANPTATIGAAAVNGSAGTFLRSDGAPAIGANAVTNALLAAATQNTVKGAATSTVETDLAVGSCSTATSALIWTTNTGFGCNTFGAGANFAVPVTVGQGGTNATSASGTAVDNISGFASTGFLTRTGAGAYSFQSLTNGVTLANLAQIATNTVAGNATAGTANIAALAVGSCSTATSALIWTTNTGFGCNTFAAGANAALPLSIANGGSGAATQALNTVFSNWTSGTAAPAWNTWPSCSAANNGLIYTNGTGVGCFTTFAVLAANTFTATQTINNSTANQYSVSMGPATLASGTTGFGDNITGTVNDASAVDGIIQFANITCTACTATSYLVDWQVASASQFKVDTGGNLTMPGVFTITGGGVNAFTGSVQIGSGKQISWNTRGIISSPAAGGIQIGAPDVASPVAQTLSMQSVVAGNTNVAGANTIIQGSLSNGSGNGGDIAFKTSGHVAGSGVQNTGITALTISGTDQSVTPAVSLKGPTGIFWSATAPSACTEAPSGTCSFTTTNGTAEFKITLATSGSSTSISWTMPAAATEWNCQVWDGTTTATTLKQTTWATNSVTMTYNGSPGATDVLHGMCLGG